MEMKRGRGGSRRCHRVALSAIFHRSLSSSSFGLVFLYVSHPALLECAKPSECCVGFPRRLRAACDTAKTQHALTSQAPAVALTVYKHTHEKRQPASFSAPPRLPASSRLGHECKSSLFSPRTHVVTGHCRRCRSADVSVRWTKTSSTSLFLFVYLYFMTVCLSASLC